MEGLTKKQREFVKEYAKTENGTQSALKAYDVKDETVAASVATENLRKPYIATAIEEVKRTLAERIPDELLEKRHLDLLNKVDDKGNIDVQAISKGLDMGYKLKGAYAPEKTQSLNVNVDITNPKARELAEEYELKLKQNL